MIDGFWRKFRTQKADDLERKKQHCCKVLKKIEIKEEN